MINKINKFQSWIGTVSAATLGVFSGYFVNEIILWQNYQWFLLLLLIVFIVFFEKTLLYLLKRVIGGSVGLRKIIAENHFIEGCWMEKLINPKEHDKPYGYAILQIRFSEMEYVVSGEVVNGELTDIIGNFNSNYAEYNNYTLSYYFKGTNVIDDSQNVVGRGDIEFVPNGKIPIRFRGVIIDTKNHSLLKVEAEKMNDTETQKYMNECSREINAIQLLKEHFNL